MRPCRHSARVEKTWVCYFNDIPIEHPNCHTDCENYQATDKDTCQNCGELCKKQFCDTCFELRTIIENTEYYLKTVVKALHNRRLK